jgi:hypothetical protein
LGQFAVFHLFAKITWASLRKGRGCSPLVPFIFFFVVVWTGAKARIICYIYRIFGLKETILNLVIILFKDSKEGEASIWGELKNTHFTIFLTCRRFYNIGKLTLPLKIPQVCLSLHLIWTAFWSLQAIRTPTWLPSSSFLYHPSYQSTLSQPS